MIGRTGVVTALMLWMAWAAVAVEPGIVPEDLASFTSAAAGSHRGAFPEAQWQELDRINRVIREVRNVRPPGASEDTLAQAEAQRQRAWEQLRAILGESSDVLTIRVSADDVTADFPEPLRLPGYAGALLVRIENGDGPVGLATIEHNFAQTREQNNPAPVRYVPGGVTWLLLSFHDVPKGRTATALTLARENASPLTVPLTLQTPEDARVSVTVLDDDGAPVPAMVRLYWKTGNVHYLPSNALDFVPQFESQGNVTSLRTTFYGASVPGMYGCAPGPFTMQVAPGEWEITVRRGIEHEIVTESIVLESGASVAKEFTLRRWVDMPARGWYSGDDHVHGRIMSDDDAMRLLTWAKAEDVHLVNVVKMGDLDRTYFEQRGFGPAFRVADGDYILSPGQECPRTHGELGHTLSMNTTEMVRDTDKYFLYDWVFETVAAQGGLSGYAHANTDLFQVHRDMTMNVPKQVVDFAEILQFNILGVDLYYEFLNLGFLLTASAGSDVPWGGTVGEARVYAYLGDAPFTADAWFAAVDRGRTFVSSGPMLELRVNEALPGDTIQITEDTPLRVTARAWGHEGRTMLSKLEVIQHGEIARDAASESGAEALEIDVTLDAGYGTWIAARAFTVNGAAAHTTPVYVERAPLRFWKHAAVPNLVVTRLAQLDEIEQVVHDARIAVDDDAADRTKRLLAQQSDALMERVHAARELYRTLLKTAEDEADTRAAGSK